jgi:putative ABC transport system permease protein
MLRQSVDELGQTVVMVTHDPEAAAYAVGMSRRQVRTLVRYESVITALIGAILGTILGVIFASLLAVPLADEGFELSFPVGTLLTLLVLAALAGVLAAIFPARRAARLDVLRALAYE